MKRNKKKQNKASLLVFLALLALLGAMLSVRMRRPAPQETEPTPVPTAQPAETAALPSWKPEPEPEPEPATDPEAGSIRISEYMTKNRAALRSADGKFYDWLELQNVSDHPVSLAGWTIAEGKKSWTLPDRSLDAGDCLLLFASGLDRADTELHTNFSLSGEETLLLCCASGVPSDQLVCHDPGSDCSAAADRDGVFTDTLYPTPGYENSRVGYTLWQSGLENEGPLVISEAAVKNYDFAFDGEEDYPDWIELKNVSGQAIELSDYSLSDSFGEEKKLRLPAGRLEAGGIRLLLCTDAPEQYEGYDCLPLSLDSEKERLYLTDENGLVDFIPLRDIPFGGSYGRMDGENGGFFFTEPTPGETNASGFRYLCARPEALTEDGVFEGVDSVTLELRGEGEIYYTLDGSLPTAESSRYAGPIVIDKTCAVRAVCMDGVGLCSRPASFSFILNEGHTLPVLSLVGDDPAALAGMYQRGVKGHELPGSVSFYEDGGSFTIDCGIRMSGRASLKSKKKSLALIFRGSYGRSRLDYDLFGGGLTSFSSLNLRAGTDSEKAVIRNELCQDLAAQFTDRLINQRSRYCVAYFNGEYYGVYALKERISRQFCADYAGVDKDSVTIYDGPGVAGEDFYETIVYPILYQDITDPEIYEGVCRHLDIDSYIDWLILEGYTGNRDIIYGNVSYFRSEDYDGGRWNTIFYDLDATFRDGRYHFHNLYNLNYSINQNSQMLSKLLKNEDFRQAYLSRAAEALNGPLSNENVVATMERLYGEIDGEMRRNCERWEFDYDNYLSCRENLIKLITDIDYYNDGIDVISLMAGLTDEERAAFFGR